VEVEEEEEGVTTSVRCATRWVRWARWRRRRRRAAWR